MSFVDKAVNIQDQRTGFLNPEALSQQCYHCGEPVPAAPALYVEIDKKARPMCCSGCQAVARAIVDYGLTDFYKFRQGRANKADELVPAQLEYLAAYDDAALQADLLEADTGNIKSTSLLLADLSCPACVWLIESRLSHLPGIQRIQVNYSTQRARVQWDAARICLSEILRAIATLGYSARPYDISQVQKQLDAEQKNQLRCLGLAAVLGVQVMMLSIALYVGDGSGMQQHYRMFFYQVCLLLTTPVIFYSGQTFFRRAWRDLRLLRTGMDVPVSLGLGLAYSSSVWTTFSGHGQVYYDSIVMFVFFLLSGRYFEFRARRRSALYVDSIAGLIPVVATRLLQAGDSRRQEAVPVASIQQDDILLIHPGEVIPVDGFLIDGETHVNESVLNGESRAVRKAAGEMLYGGSSNIDQAVKIRVARTGSDTTWSHIYRLAQQGQRVRPVLITLTNRISAWFVFAVLVLAALTAWYWHVHDVTMWLPITISVLVVCCPCALSLATPVALATVSTTLLKQGAVLVNGDAIEALNRVAAYVFDKTGTLTADSLEIIKTIALSAMPAEQCLEIATAMEANSLHPVAKAFAGKASADRLAVAGNSRIHAGAGISAEVNGRQYFLGTEKFITRQTGLTLAVDPRHAERGVSHTHILLADKTEIHAVFVLQDCIRQGAEKLLAYLRAQGKPVSVLSGDNQQATNALARQLNLQTAFGRQTPELKMAHIRRMQQAGKRVAMVGDGVNDAPVLACADVSIAMGDGTDLVSTHADLILLNSRLDKLITVIELAAKTRSIIRQNMFWAVCYNLVALPLAAAGLITPWMAALGMSASSLVVVLNSGRLIQSS